MSDRITSYIALGSNLGDRAANIAGALAMLRDWPGVEITCCSQLMETAPIGPPGQGPYLNAAAALQTNLPPRELLGAFFAIEAAHGRIRTENERWGPRQLDIDLLLYGQEIINEPGLHVPHPRMAERLFVLAPLAEIAPELVHPSLGMTIQSLLHRLRRQTPAEYGLGAPCSLLEPIFSGAPVRTNANSPLGKS